MKTSKLWIVLCIAALAAAGKLYAQTLHPNLMRFDTATTNIQEYVVHSITSCIHSASFALIRPLEIYSSSLDEPISIPLSAALDLQPQRCVEVLKGDPAIGGDGTCYHYKPLRLCSDLPMRMRIYPVTDDFREINNLKPEEFLYWDYGIKKGRGKYERWRVEPPYDIGYGWFRHSETVRLAILTLEHRLLIDRVDTQIISRFPFLRTADGGAIKTEDAKKMKPEELMKVLGVESVFSNRVFRLNEGCVFYVDYELPKEMRKPGASMPDDVPTEMMRLSPEEVSEVVRLAYAVDGDAAGYDAACARCPQLLRPVAEFHTKIGRMLRQALSEGGMLPKGAPPAAQE